MTLLPMTGYNPERPWEAPTKGPLGQQPIGWQDFPDQQPSAPFVWGQGGARLTPEQIMAQREIAQGQMKADFSPVGSVWEGLGRVANNVTGALQGRSLGKQDAANRAESDALLQAIMGGDKDAVTAGLTSPYASPQVQQFAKMQYDRQNPKPRTPFEFEGLLGAAGFQPGTPEYQAQANKLLQNRGDPFVTATLPTGDFYAGPQSQFGTYLQGQGQPQAAAPMALHQGGPVVGMIEDGYRFKGGNPADRNSWEPVGGQTLPASGGFRPGA